MHQCVLTVLTITMAYLLEAWNKGDTDRRPPAIAHTAVISSAKNSTALNRPIHTHYRRYLGNGTHFSPIIEVKVQTGGCCYRSICGFYQTVICLDKKVKKTLCGIQ